MSDNDYKTTEAANQRLAEIASPIAKALGAGWTDRALTDGDGEIIPHHVDLIGPNGEQIGLSCGWPKDGKLRITCRLDTRVDGLDVFYVPYGTQLPAINVALSKSPATIAADIQRRVLPDYLPIFQECQARKAEHVQEASVVRTRALKLAAVVGADLYQGDRESPTQPRLDVYRSRLLREYSGDVTVRQDEVAFAFSVSHEAAAKILAILVEDHTARKFDDK